MNKFTSGSSCLLLHHQQIPAYGSLERSQSLHVPLNFPFLLLKKQNEAKPPKISRRTDTVLYLALI